MPQDVRFFQISLFLILGLMRAGTCLSWGQGSPSPVIIDETTAILPAGKVYQGDLVIEGKDIVIEGRLEGLLVATGGSVKIIGDVTGGVLAVRAPVILYGSIEPTFLLYQTTAELHGTVRGALWTWGTATTLHEGASIQGSWIRIGDSTQGLNPAEVVQGPIHQFDSTEHLISALIRQLSLPTAFAVIVLWFTGSLMGWWFARDAILRGSNRWASRISQTFFSGLIVMIVLTLLLALSLLLSAMIIGFPLLLMVLLTAFFLVMYGLSMVFHATGRWMLRLIGFQGEPSGWLCWINGWLAASVLFMAPWVGLFFFLLTNILALGAATISLMPPRNPKLLSATSP